MKNDVKTSIRLTQSAERGLAANASLLRGISLGAWVQTGDIIELPGKPDKVALVVNSRRIVVQSDGEYALEIVLDYPARPALR